MIVGRTGSGKTTLLLQIERAFLKADKRLKVIHRDDGKCEFLYQLPVVGRIKVFIPYGCRFVYEDIEGEVAVQHYDPDNPLGIIDNIARSRGFRYFVVMFDNFCINPDLSAEFWAKWWTALIYHAMSTPLARKKPILLSFEEINDILRPRGWGITKVHDEVEGLLSYNFNKLRGHGIRLLCSTHRPQQLSRDIRSQIDWIFIKRSSGDDIYDWLNRILIRLSNPVFYYLIGFINEMPQEQFVAIDPYRKLDICVNEDIERWPVQYEIGGCIKRPERTKRFDEIDMFIAVARAKPNPMPFKEIAKHVKLNIRTVYKRWEKLRQEEFLAPLLYGED